MLSSLPGQHRGFQPKEQRFIHASAVSEFKWKPRRLLWPEISGVFKYPINPSSRLQHQLISSRKFKRRIQGDISRYTLLQSSKMDVWNILKYRQPPLHSSYVRPVPGGHQFTLLPSIQPPCALPSVAFAVLPVSPRPSSLLHLELVQEWMTLKKDPAWSSQVQLPASETSAAGNGMDSTMPPVFLSCGTMSRVHQPSIFWVISAPSTQPLVVNQHISTDLNQSLACLGSLEP